MFNGSCEYNSYMCLYAYMYVCNHKSSRRRARAVPRVQADLAPSARLRRYYTMIYYIL